MDPKVCCPNTLLRKLKRPQNHVLIPEAVAYQFAKIGKNEAALDLVKGLDDDKLLGTYIDCMGTSSGDDIHQLFVYVSYLLNLKRTRWGQA